jgi:hypothetical protein
MTDTPSGRYFEQFPVTQTVTVRNQRDEAVIEGQQTVLLRRRPAAA